MFYFISQESLQIAGVDDEERRRPFDGLVIDWYVNHGFAIFSIVAMIIFNIYAWIVINSYRQVYEITKNIFRGILILIN